MDGYRHGAQLRTRQHHHRQHVPAGMGFSQFTEKLGMAGMPETRRIERQLVDRCCGKRARPAGHDEIDAGADIVRHMGGIAGMRLSRLALQRTAGLQYRQRIGEHFCRLSGLALADRHLEREPAGQMLQIGGIAHHHKGRHIRLTAGKPCLEDNLRPDAGRLSQAYGNRKGSRAGRHRKPQR